MSFLSFWAEVRATRARKVTRSRRDCMNIVELRDREKGKKECEWEG